MRLGTVASIELRNVAGSSRAFRRIECDLNKQVLKFERLNRAVLVKVDMFAFFQRTDEKEQNNNRYTNASIEKNIREKVDVIAQLLVL